MPAVDSFEKPRWLRDLLRFLPLKSQFVLSGNVRDVQLSEAGPGTVSPRPLLHLLGAELRASGYAHVFAYDPIAGFRVVPAPGDQGELHNEFLREFGLQGS